MVLLLIVAVPLFFSAGFILQQQLIKHQMKQELARELLQTVRMPAADAVWLNEKQELMIEGRLFDVEDWQIEKDELTVTGLFDEDEDKLNKQLQVFADQKENSQSPLNNLVSEFFSSPVYAASIDFTTDTHWCYINKVNYNYTESIPAPPFLSDILPPKL